MRSVSSVGASTPKGGATPNGAGTDPIAIVGLAFEFPGGCDTVDAFWQVLLERRNMATEAPKDRYSAESMWHPDASRHGSVAMRGGHYLTRDISAFDAPFFNISDTEAAALDPQQRGLIETAFRAFENAGQIMSRVAGSNTSVFTGCFTDDWKQVTLKDAEQCPSHAALGVEASMLANRLSWFFNLQGASCNLDSACSSSLLAVDLACKSLASGDCNMSLAAGSNLVLYPDIIHGLSNLGLLSPDNQCYSFDSRANGYARGEGFGVLILKRLSDALANNDCIRAVIRATGSNQDGYTPNITNPSGKAQAELIRRTYARAGLSLADTKFVEAHGTGTAAGDPIEIEAIGSVFRSYRSNSDPLYIGAVKSNIGHLEGASGIAGLIKAVLVLEKGVIPPNAMFKQLNPKIDLKYLRIKLPQEPTLWPSKGVRRASVNSFGFGGSNTHVVLDDAHHYLKGASLRGNHNTIADVGGTHLDKHGSYQEHTDAKVSQRGIPKLIVFSANDEAALISQVNAHSTFLQGVSMNALNHGFLDDLLYTINERRYAFPWRTAALIRSPHELKDLKSLVSKARRSVNVPSLCLVFTGQGAQYPGSQLRVLEQFDIFRHRLNDAQQFLLELGCPWNVRDELYKTKEDSHINDAEFSQPLSTILQIALIDLIRSFRVHPEVVVGHSSGEIAAAYCIGALSAHSAISVAYYRGYHSAKLAASGEQNGSMMAVGLSAQEAHELISKHASNTGGPKLTVACINSPKSVTISGDSGELDVFSKDLGKKGVFARKLNVNMAYHSPMMEVIADSYRASLQGLEPSPALAQSAIMLSTVTGEWVRPEVLRHPQYWVNNMVSPVQFSPAVEKLTFHSHGKVWKKLNSSHRNHPKATFMLEIGFHGALKGPLRDILNTKPDGSKIIYEASLLRGQDPLEILVGSLGQLFCHGYPVDLAAINIDGAKSANASKILHDLPSYQFNHSKSYWEEGRISRRYRLHPQRKLDLLGKPFHDWNQAEAKWRNFIRVTEIPWVEDHKINGSLIYPGAGMLVMAIEAANQLATEGREIEGFELRDIRFLSTLGIPRSAKGIETNLYLRETRDTSSSETPWCEFRLFCFENDNWTENCRGSIQVQYKSTLNGTGTELNNIEQAEELLVARKREDTLPDSDGYVFEHEQLYASLRDSGYDFGPSFQLVRKGVFVKKDAKADVKLYDWSVDAYPQPHIVHPCSLDAILHLAVAALADGGRTKISTAIPSAFRRLWIAKDGLSNADATLVRTSAWMTENDSRGSDYNISVLNASRTRVLMRGLGLRLIVVANLSTDQVSVASDGNQICFHLDWKPDDSFKSDTYRLTVPWKVVIVVDPASKLQKDVVSRIQVLDSTKYVSLPLAEAAQVTDASETVFLFLEELEKETVMDLSATDYSALQTIFTHCKASLWVTNGGGRTPQHPAVGVSSGMFRVLRNERPEHPYATLGLSLNGPTTDDQIRMLHDVLQRIACSQDLSHCDQEYSEIDGVLHIPRVQEALDITDNIYQGTLAHQSAVRLLASCPPVKLSVGSIGFLDTLHFTEDEEHGRPLLPDEVEIKVRASGINFRDILVALGRVPGSVYGSEAAGIVSRIGESAQGFSVGDRVVMAGANIRTYARAKAHHVLKIEDKMSFAEAASISTQFCTAWHAISELARLQADECILVHTGAGGTGQAAIQVSQYIGSTVFATVGSEIKKQLLVQEYGIPESHIFYSRDTSFAKGIMRITNGQGVDVVINSLAGGSLIASWECIAPYGRFVEIGKKDILQNSSLPMRMFRQNTSFFAFDGFALQTERPKVFEALFKKVMKLFNEGALRPVLPLNIFPVSKIEDCFRTLQDGNLAGKMILEVEDNMEVKTILQTKPSFYIDDKSTYVIAGGLGGLGRNVARWLVDRGAKHLLLLSRSGSRTAAAQDFLQELKDCGVSARAPPCDVTDITVMTQVVLECARDMPPIKGCVQGSMVLRDSTFDKMSYVDWRLGTDCKTIGSWNLHLLLPHDLDFFVMLSSASGVVGLHGQANYAAGNAYMDALARYRVSAGLRATSLDMGALIDDGLLAEDPDFLKRVLSYGALNGISRNYFNAIMDYYCNPSLPLQTSVQCQPIIGLHTGEDSIITSGRPMFSSIVSNVTSTTGVSQSERQNWKTIFNDPSTYDIPHLVVDALVRKLAKTNSSLQGEVDLQKPLVSYGVDSLLAVELRSWLAKEFGADIALFEIQGGVGLEGLARTVASRSSFSKVVTTD